jgi:hypothetical protein
MDAVIGDLCVQDTFCYTAGDNFRIYNFANPMQPTQVGVVGDGGDVIAEVNGYAYVGHGSSGSGLNVYDVSDPSSPALVNTLGGVQLSLFVRGQMLFRTSVQPSYFQILDVSDPTSIHEIGRIDGYGGIGLYADDYFAYLSCTYDHEGLFVIDISNPANPQLRDSLDPEGTDKWDSYVPAEVSYGYLASGYGGLVALDLHNVDSICEAWSGYKADRSIDIVVDGPRAYVANKLSGLQILYVGDPTAPVTLGLYDTVGARNTYTAVASDSFAFISRTGQPRFYFRVLDVTDPVLPVPVAQETCTSWPLDMVLRDSFCYAAGINRFFVFNVARPREPVLVGSCASTDGTDFALAVLDTFAYIAADMTQVIDVARPDSPYVVTTIGRASWDLSIVDSMLFCEPGPAIWYSLANPAVPVPIDSIDMGHWITGMTAVNRTIYACSGPSYSTLYAISIADLHQPRVIAQASLPYVAKRITYAAPYLYLSCEDAGVCIYETTQVGVQEPSQNASRRMKPMPTVVRGAEWRKVTQDALVFDAIGRRVTQARPGVYFIVEEPQASSHKLQAVRKVVLTE